VVVAVCAVGDVLRPVAVRGGVVSLEGVSAGNLEGCALVVTMIVGGNAGGKGRWAVAAKWAIHAREG
jgi:hypothetical protein